MHVMCNAHVIMYRVWRRECITFVLVQLPMPSSLLLTRLAFRLRTRHHHRRVETFSPSQASLLQTAKLHFSVHWKTKRIVSCAAAEHHSACRTLLSRITERLMLNTYCLLLRAVMQMYVMWCITLHGFLFAVHSLWLFITVGVVFILFSYFMYV